MKNYFVRFTIGMIVSCFVCAGVWAQGIAQISGTVRDQTFSSSH